ncbi:MAG: phosphoadenylyl-sulfate reductase [Proteobacteria bacterium]|nr:phosphoadenylyl-sulfate reductase [Pseudomonadota bacterium]
MTINKEKIEHTLQQLGHISQQYKPATFANSFGAEDIVLVDLIAQHAPEIEIFSLDTGRLPQETYTLMQAVRERYPALQFKTYFPAAADVESYVENHGPNGFYSSIELRKKCCHIRKVEPLQRALSGKKAWITGLRKEQGATRENLADAEWDDLHGLKKFNPLANWSESDVWDYIHHHQLPYNPLHDKGYPSIGCAPCTRAITKGEDIRAGRWWWENPETKECGLHPVTLIRA